MDNSFVLLFVVIIASIITAGIVWFILKHLHDKHLTNTIDNLQALHQSELINLHDKLENFTHNYKKLDEQNNKNFADLNMYRTDLQNSLNKLASLQEQNKELLIIKQEKKELLERNDILMQEKQKMAANIAHLGTKLEHEQLQNHEKLELLQDSKIQLETSFKLLAQDIFEEKSKKFTEQNQSNLFQLLEPLKLQITEFKGKVEQAYDIEGKERTALSEQVKTMMQLNQQLSKEANNLAKALKGDNKIQGNWGELILERVLELGGLSKDREYKIQEGYTNTEGNRIQPDVVVHLPANRYIVIDAKASINAYNDYLQTDKEESKAINLRKHIDSIRNHIKGLSDKNYQNIKEEKSPNFVLMFIPIESAFMLAVANDNNLWQFAWQKNILIVSPTTLLFVIRMIDQIWRNEYQNQNTKDIVKRGAELYDKLAGFVDDMQKIGDHINKSKDYYDKAFNKFKSGKGNVIRQAEMLKELGVMPSKKLPDDILDTSIQIDSIDSINTTENIKENNEI